MTYSQQRVVSEHVLASFQARKQQRVTLPGRVLLGVIVCFVLRYCFVYYVWLC